MVATRIVRSRSTVLDWIPGAKAKLRMPDCSIRSTRPSRGGRSAIASEGRGTRECAVRRSLLPEKPLGRLRVEPRAKGSEWRSDEEDRESWSSSGIAGRRKNSYRHSERKRWQKVPGM